MKKCMKNIVAFALVVMILLSTASLSLTALAIDADQVKVSNWGTRDEVCLTLDGTGAENYYTGTYSYDNLTTLSSSNLKSTLKTLMTTTHDYTSSYNDCHDLADKTDCEDGNGKVTLIYTSYQATMSQWNGWNREHVWPQSLGGDNTSGGGADLHHIRPSDQGVNSSRGNKPYGEAGSGASSKYGTNPAVGYLGGYYNSTYFEPLDNVKGDVARICLYMYVRWGSGWGCDSLTEIFQSVDLLLEWCALDPVDTWEMGRNDVVEEIQGNRNVFIDYPELAWKMLGKTAPANMTTPSSGDSSGSTSCNHSSTTIKNAVAATCGKDGYTGDTYCTLCNRKLSTGSNIAKTGNHTWGQAVVITPATETTNGTAKSTCTVCGETKTSSIPATGGGTEVPPDIIGGETVIAEKSASDMQTTLTTEFALDDNISVLFGKGTTNAAFNNGAIRIYQKGGSITVTAKNGVQIKSVIVSYTSGMNGGGNLTVTGGTLTSDANSTLTFTANSGATSVKITCSGTNSGSDRIYLTNLAVEYVNPSATPEPPACTHTNTTIKNATSATCTTAGYTGDTVCISCGVVITSGASIPAKGHTEATVPGKAATCTAAGLTEGKKCSVCNAVTVAQTTIPAKGHTEVTVPGTAATCTEPGVSEGKVCTVCNVVLVEQETIEALGHNFVDNACSVCGTSKPVEPCLEHEFVGDDCQTYGKCIHCGEYSATYGDHKTVTDAAVAPDCTSTGLTAGSHCSVCGETLVAQEPIPALGHTWTSATCTAAKTCTVCGATDGTALGHTEVIDAAVSATCQATGLTEGKHCSVCNEVLVAQTVTPMGDHVEVTLEAVAPTCGDTGLTEGKMCTVCGEHTVPQTIIPFTGAHVYGEEEVVVAPTETEDGEGKYTCTVCGHCEASVIPALGTPQAPPATYDDIIVAAIMALESEEARILLLISLGLLDTVYYDLVANQ